MGDVISLKTEGKEDGGAFTKRWGARVADHHFTMVPSIFFALQAKLGLSGALLLLPAALLGSSGVFAVLTIVHSRTILRMIEGGLKASIHRSMWEQVYLLIARPYRDMAKTVVDGAFQRLAEGLGSLVLVLWFATSHKPVEQLNFSWILWVIMAAMVLWLGLTRYLSHLGCSNLTPTEVYIRLPDG